MIFNELNLWVAILGSICAASCALPGTVLVLRKQSMMGDAISHTVLPGIAIAFLLTHSRAPLPMFLGAAVVGIITAFAVQWVQKLGRMDAGAAMGVVFTSLFAIGLLLMSSDLLHRVDLDAECVLYGNIDAAAGHIVASDTLIPRQLWTNASVLLLNTLLFVGLYKEFKLTAFDPALADSLGISSRFMHYLLMTITAVTTVVAFETVGSVIVIAMLIVPASAAYLLTDRFNHMLVIAVAFAVLTATLGTFASVTVPTWFGFGETVSAGAMATVAGLGFILVWLIAPRHGLISKRLTRLALNRRILREDILGLLYRLEEVATDHDTPFQQTLRAVLHPGPINTRLALATLASKNYITRDGGAVTLTDTGRTRARQLVRTHRLWETYLSKYIDVPVDHVHGSAERLEHVTDDHMQRRLADETAFPTTDPHGRAVPPDTND